MNVLWRSDFNEKTRFEKNCRREGKKKRRLVAKCGKPKMSEDECGSHVYNLFYVNTNNEGGGTRI